MTGTTSPLTGGCQCGAVRYRLLKPPHKVSVCFCRMCQKAVGNYFGAFASSRTADVVWTRGTPSVFRSSEVAERGFCRECGTPLSFSYPAAGTLALAVGSLDDATAFSPTHAYGVEGRAPWFDALCRLEAHGPRTISRRMSCRVIARASIPIMTERYSTKSSRRASTREPVRGASIT